LSDSAPCDATTPIHGEASRRWWGLAVILTGAFMAIMDLFIVNISLPSMRVDLHASFADAQLIVAGYALTYAVALITGGRLGDLHGRRRIFIAGLAGFTLASLACGMAPTSNVLIVARLFQGLTAAALFPQVLSLMRVNFVDPRERAIAFAMLGATQGLASIAGQVGGGLLVAADIWGLGWRPVFLINVPIGCVTMIAAARVLAESRASDARRLDLAGVAMSAVPLSLLLYPLMEGREAGWPSWAFVMLGLSIPGLITFAWHQHRKSAAKASPLVDTRLFRHGAFTAGMIAVLTVCTALFSFFLIFTFVLQGGLGRTPLVAGAVIVPLAIAYGVASFAAGCAGPGRSRTVLLVGGIVLMAGYGAVIGVNGLTGDRLAGPEYVPALILLGIGQGLVFTPLLNVVLANVSEQDAGTAAGVVSTMQQLGGALGVAIVGLIFFTAVAAARQRGLPDVAAYREAFSIALLYNVAAAAATTVLIALLPQKPVRL
jgi:EmrB/QacA subfamily drug resistance transporter